ncbi:MAG TPA: radical SAM/SPASM family putative metalloenzyme maturase [Spirochaetota bacterium]|nr:radical SAM/SPASM family putative metalloenzyme maturase [Spirochaetota bacterium]
MLTRPNPALKEHPSKLFVEITTRCNLRCAMCVKQSGAACLPEGDLSRAHFASLEECMGGLDALVLNGIGEPLLHPDLEYFIGRAGSLMPAHSWVGFQTNGFLLDQRRADSIMGAGARRVCVSVDAVSAKTFSAVRGVGDPSVVGSALAALARAAGEQGRGDFMPGIEFVAMRENIVELPAVMEWGARLGIRFAIITQLLPYQPAMLSGTAYDTSTDAALVFYEKWRHQALAEKIDISRYFNVFMKFIRDDSEERIVRHVDAMVADAAAHGISLNLNSLMARDEAMLTGVQKALEQAERIARENGIELTLPGTVPKSVRRCDFVEEGSVFVSWDGKVHPCHFLWHRFQCYLGGVENNIKPMVFGDLGRDGILAIWNAAEFRTFRENVIRYNFPFCYDCSLALCDLVQTEDFEQDCYITGVPCASCLWCTGLFHCLR